MMLDASSLEEGLAGFSGSETFYTLGPLFPRVVWTDGVNYLAENAGAYWLGEAIASHLVAGERVREMVASGMVFWRLEKLEDGSWLLSGWTDTAHDPDSVCLARQEIPFSDFPLDSVDIWSAWRGDGWTIFLPSEY